MEEDEMEMTKEELQKWIRERVKVELISPDVLEKCNLLQSLLERREQQAANFLKLCESVTACEAIVKKQYSLLGWEYRDTDSDDDDNITDCGNIPSSPCESVHSETQVPSPPATNRPTPLSPKQQNSANLKGDDGRKSSLSLKRKLVVVLTRLPKCKIAKYSEHESLSNSDSDIEWQPADDSDDLDYCFSRANKRRKIDQNKEKLAKSNLTKTSKPQASANTDAKSNARKTSVPQATTNTDSRSNTEGTSTPQGNRNTNPKRSTTSLKTSLPQARTNTDSRSNTQGTSTPQGNRNTNAKSKTTSPKTSLPQARTNTDGRSNTGGTSTPKDNKNINAESNTSSKPANTNRIFPVCIVSTLCQSSDKATTVPPSVPQEKITVGMNVLARRRATSWKCGKIMEIVKKEDGGLKYKISFEEKGKSLVSGHHIAFHCVPKVDQLYIGARVVVKCQDNELFRPGILAELPSRKNHARFLVFIDDHTPVYVGLPLLHLVCRPLKDALDDIPDSPHKYFMKQYLKDWPYPHLTQCRPGQTLNAELNGVQQRCEVQVVDCSLIQVVFQDDQHKEWIHRGSIRLEHVARFLEIKRREENKDD